MLSMQTDGSKTARECSDGGFRGDGGREGCEVDGVDWACVADGAAVPIPTYLNTLPRKLNIE